MLSIDPKALVSQEAILLGQITLFPNCLISPKAKINAGKSEALFGEGNIVEELACIETTQPRPLVIGSYNLFCAGCVVRDAMIGDGCVIEEKCVIDGCTLIGGNTVAAGVILKNEILEKDDAVFLVDGKVKIQKAPDAMKRNLDMQNIRIATLQKILSLGKLRKN